MNQPTPPDGYEYHEEGDMIREGDQFHDYKLGWRDTALAGNLVNNQAVGRYRRKLAPNKTCVEYIPDAARFPETCRAYNAPCARCGVRFRDHAKPSTEKKGGDEPCERQEIQMSISTHSRESGASNPPVTSKPEAGGELTEPSPMQYKDVSGNHVTIDWLVRNEPAWAANQIRHRDTLQARLDAAEQKPAESLALIDVYKRSDAMLLELVPGHETIAEGIAALQKAASANEQLVKEFKAKAASICKCHLDHFAATSCACGLILDGFESAQPSAALTDALKSVREALEFIIINSTTVLVRDKAVEALADLDRLKGK